MRLLMVSGDRQLAAGIEGPFWNLQRDFALHFDRVDVVCPRPAGPVVQRELVGGRLHLHPASCGRAGMLGYVRRKGAELLARHGHGLVTSHDYGWFYNGLGSAWLSARTGVPYVSEIHHVPGYPVAADLRERFDREVARRYVRFATPRARAFRVVNEREIPPLLRSWGVPEEKIAVIGSLYVDLDRFAPRAEEAPERDVVFVGRMVPNKGLDRLVDALAILAREGRPASALLVGTGPCRRRVEARVHAKGLAERVDLRDWVGGEEELARVYRTSRAVVCASTCEGGPRFTVEAMACGTPAVSTRVGIMGELLEDGRAGRLVGWSVAELAAGIEVVLADEEARLRMGVEARRIAARFERGRAIRAYAEGLARLAERSLAA